MSARDDGPARAAVPAGVVGAAGGALTAAELDALLRRPLLARLATLRADGYPGIVPVWIEWDGTAAWIVARARASFVVDLRHDPRACISVVADDDPDLRAQLVGRAEIVGAAGPLAGRALDIARSMALRYEGESGVAYIERSRGWDRILVRFVPEHIVAWGSAEWHPRYATDPAGVPGSPDPGRSNP